MLSTWIKNSGRYRKPKWPTKVFLDDSHSPAFTAYEYRRYIITVWARPEFTNGFTSVGIVYKPGQLGSIVQVQRIEGEVFSEKEEAEQHGVDLCTEWIDQHIGLGINIRPKT